MAVEAEFFSENLGSSQGFMIPTQPPSLSPLLPPPQHNQPQPCFVPSMEMGFNVNNQGNVSYPSSSSTAVVNEDSLPFAAMLEKQMRDINLYLYVQGERLKEALQQQKSQQLQFVIKSFESRTMALMREKEENLEKQRVKTKLLEECLIKSVEETEVWQSIAKEKHEKVIELNNMLLMIQRNLLSSTLQPNDGDAESVYECEAIEEEVKVSEEMKKKVVCKCCNNGELCVVFLPCRHLCCCKDCETVLGLCPLCQSVKQGSVEILFS